MPKAKPLSDDASSAHPHGAMRREEFGPCALCGEPIMAGQTVQMMVADEDGGRFRRTHLRCFHERAMTNRAMARPS
jgi:hypothetical protein